MSKTKEAIFWGIVAVVMVFFFSLTTHPIEWNEIEAANGQQQSHWFKEKPK